LKKDEDVLIGVNFGRNGEDALVSLSNKEIEHSLLKDLGIILGVTEKPLFSIIKRWRDAVPQFTVTQEEDVQQAKQILLDEYPGIYIAGQGLAGSSINHCIQQANHIADQIVEYAKKQNCL
ncbi:MAG: protoporphyrinogen oxidase, partial [Carnobacterium sp.]